MYILKAVMHGAPLPELRYDDIADALNQARAFFHGGCTDVSIEDGLGSRADRSELVGVCRGERSLPDDLNTT